jgi:G3E family GTPase
MATAAAQQMFQRASMTSLGPGAKTPPKHIQQGRRTLHKPSKARPNLTRTDQHQHDPKTHESSNSFETNPTKHTHRSDRSRALVRPVEHGQLRMNRTRGSTPPNPTPDLPISSTDPNKTLGIVGTPHGHSIAKLWSTKTH